MVIREYSLGLSGEEEEYGVVVVYWWLADWV